jgi:hypothetical protein
MARHAPVASPRVPTVPPLHLEPTPRNEPAAAPVTSFPVFPTAPTVEHVAPTAAPSSRWAVFEQLGLVPNPQKTAKFLVSTYRLLGFGILSIIVIVLVAYIATSAFYFVSDSWIQPMVVSKSDEKVLSIQAQLAEQENVRDRILADIANADRTIEVQQAFQGEFAKAIRADLSGRKAALSRVRELARDYAGARQRIKKSNQAFANASRRRMEQEYAARLIDRSDVLSGKFQLAQITGSNLSLAERQVEYETRAAALTAEAKSLDAILTRKGGDGALSYDVLRIKQEYEMSRLETARAIDNRGALRAALGRQETIIAGLKLAPYLRAVSVGANVAFIPYDNLDGVETGEPLYRCALGMIFCREVGQIKEVMPGEVSFKHPHREKLLRGRMVELDLEKKDAAEEDVLFVGGRPLFI